ncbi:MAG: hypothetical protein L0I48_05285 [Lactococcus plantarum]|nr:hypothetical protein [Lactococcus plantarum]
MDMLTKLKLLSDQLENPEFVNHFSKGFEEFLSKKQDNQFGETNFSNLKIEIGKKDLSYNDKTFIAMDRKLEFPMYTNSNVAMAA